MKPGKILSALFFALVISCPKILAQEISVASFELAETDLTANLQGSTVYDQNGEKCALIKINTTQTGFTFDVGTLGVVKVENHPAQIWVYVPHGIRKISIFHNQLGSLVNWPLPCNIDPAKTYNMRLTTAEVRVVVTEKSQMDYLVVNVEPKDAVIYIDGEIVENIDGVASKLMPYGTYTYRIVADDYHVQEGTVIVDNGKKELKIKLNPAFGFLTLQKNENLNGATIVIDGRQIASSEIKRLPLSSGLHTLNITKEFFRTIKIDFLIEDNMENSLPLAFIPDYTLLSIQTDSETEIYINEKFVGTGKWNGKLESGAYRIVGKKLHHKPSSKELIVQGVQDSQIILLDPPTPILGSANITSSPIGCKVEIDGIEVGTTPLYLDGKLLEGQHSVCFSKEGYKSEEKTITIREDKMAEMSVVLQNSAAVNISIKPSDYYVTVYIDGTAEAIRSATRKNLILGEHEISIPENERFEAYYQKIILDQDKNIEIYLVEKESYLREQERLRREQARIRQREMEQAKREYEEQERYLRRRERKLNSPGFPPSVGWTLCNLGFGSRGMNISTDLFLHLGRLKNRFNIDIGAGFSGILYETSSSSSVVGIGEVPVYVRTQLNLSKNSLVCPYLAVDARRNFSFKEDSSWSCPVRLGLAIDILRFEAIYEPFFFKSGDYRGQFSFGMVLAFEKN